MWQIITTDTFDDWLVAQDDTDRSCVLSALIVLQQAGPALCRPYADTLKGSRFSNMKELRIQSKGDPIRASYAFDPRRSGVVLCAGHKCGNEKRFYAELIPLADKEFTHHLQREERKE
jgi:hypothetical protein